MRKTRKLRGGAQVDKIRMLQHAELRNEIDTLRALIEPIINQRSEIDALKLEVTRLIALSETHDKLLLILCSNNITVERNAVFKELLNNNQMHRVYPVPKRPISGASAYVQIIPNDISYRTDSAWEMPPDPRYE